MVLGKRHLTSLTHFLGGAIIGLSASLAEVTEENMVEQWLLTERMIAQEKLDFEKQKKHTAQLIELYEKELLSLNEELSKAGQNAPSVSAEVDKNKTILENTEKARRVTIQQVAQYQPRLLALQKKLPPPLLEQLSDEFLQLEETASNANVSDNLRAILKILGETEQFNRRYTFTEHPLELSGKMYRGTVFYLGLSRAFFLAGDRAGYGISTDSGWTFTEESSLKPQIQKAISVKNKEISSDFFQLPLQVTK